MNKKELFLQNAIQKALKGDLPCSDAYECTFPNCDDETTENGKTCIVGILKKALKEIKK